MAKEDAAPEFPLSASLIESKGAMSSDHYYTGSSTMLRGLCLELVALDSFILPTFGVMRITRYDIYRIMGMSQTGDEVATQSPTREVNDFTYHIVQDLIQPKLLWPTLLMGLGDQAMIEPLLPLGGDDPAMLRWKMASKPMNHIGGCIGTQMTRLLSSTMHPNRGMRWSS
eukprot:Gb_16657 [translate_table: standard]